jgi:hypothetical protein
MTEAQLARANEITDELAKLIDSYNVVKDLIQGASQRVGNFSQNRSIGFIGVGYSSVELIEDCLPMDFITFQKLYLMKVEAKIDTLNKEFAKL